MQEEYSRKTTESLYGVMLFESEDSRNTPKPNYTKENICQIDNKNYKTRGASSRDASNADFIEIESDGSEDLYPQNSGITI